MKRSQSRARKHHYIPRFILRVFADAEDRVWWTRTDGKLKEPRHSKCANVFVKKDLYTVLAEDGISDRNERMLAKKEGPWSHALRQIRKLVSEGRDGQIKEWDALLALEYYLYAGIRTPEHLKWVMYGGEHTPQEVIDKVTEGSLGEADYDLLEHNIRADLGSGKPDLVKADIEKFKRTLGLGIYKLEPGAGNFIVGSYGMAKISWIEREIKQEKYFTPVAPDMALSCTDQPGCPRVTRQGKEGIETLHKMNTATWNASQLVAATSLELLKAVGKRAV